MVKLGENFSVETCSIWKCLLREHPVHASLSVMVVEPALSLSLLVT